MPKFKVGVFPHEGKAKTKYTAYTLWYSPEWKGCCEHEVIADTGAKAKILAIEDHKINCLKENYESDKSTS
jgi:hypothetical protein